MSILEAIVLGVIEGVTEFLPISSTGHLTIAEKLMGFEIDDADITAFTAIIQIGAVAAVVIYFCDDLWKIVTSRRSAASPTRGSGRRATSGSGSRSPSARSRSPLPACCSGTSSRATLAASGSSAGR